ncbi:MAG: hypothetical protein KF901_29420 [Myxococcales bacterium]|nr:hypothetical protein [Myxococcales bacterium]
MTRYARRYRRIARRLSRLELMETSMAALDALDDPRTLFDEAGPRRFLDYYGDEGLRTALERYGVLAAAEERGYRDIAIVTRADDDRHTLIVRASHPALVEPATLVEVVVRRDRLVPDPALGLSRLFEVLTVDWTTLRHPAGRFSPDRPRLPGQDAPGLGLGEHVLELLYRVVDRLRLDALLTVAEYFHNAVLYRRELGYFDPAHGGRCLALEEALLARERLTLAQASWAIDWGHVREGDQVVRWTGEAQLRAFDDELVRHVTSDEHRRAVREHAARLSFAFDRAAFEAQWHAEAPVLEGREG